MAKYRMRTFKDGKRVRVVTYLGVEGYIVRWTQACTGCTEVPEYTTGPDVGAGCHECGYTGKRRREQFVAFEENEKAFYQAQEEQWKKHQAATGAM